MVISTFICSECKTKIPLPRSCGNQRKKNHIKDLYCPTCKNIKKFIEYNYKEYYKTLDGEIIEKDS